MNFIAQNWKLIFGGVGTAVVAAIAAAWAKAYFEKPKSSDKKDKLAQNIRSGDDSINLQSQRDINVGGKLK